MRDIKIRQYRDSDRPSVVQLWNEVLPSNAPHNDPATSIAKKLAVDGELFFVATFQDVIVGTAMGGYDGHRGWLYSVAVKPHYRLKGIGSQLVQCLEAALRVRGCLKLNLQVVSSNPEVVSFYQKMGYAEEERISMGKRLYSSDQILTKE